MQVVKLDCNSAEDFVRRQPISAILFFTRQDHHIDALLEQFVAVAATFTENIAFGTVDLTNPENAQIMEQTVVVITPTLIYYRFGKPSGEDIGDGEILKFLNHASIVDCYCHTDMGLKLFR